MGNTTKYEYNFLNKLTKAYAPFDGEKYSITENQYDKNGNVIKTIQNVDDNKNSVTVNKYNAMGLLEKVILSDGTANGDKNITKYFYNNAGIQTKMYTGMFSENDNTYLTTEYEYDDFMRLVRTTDSTGYNSGTITYDLNGNVLTSTDANGNVTTNTYDALNRLISSDTVNPDDSSKNVSKTYIYDNMGRITRASSNGGYTTAYEYDSLGRKYSESEYSSYYSVFRGVFYEGVSQYVSREITGQYNLLLYSAKSYEYDSEMRVSKVKEGSKEIASYTYDANGNKKSETLGNGVVSTYTYNKANRITNIENKSGDITISSYEYSYFLDGSDACKVRNENGIIETTSYEYDGLKRLIEEAVKVGDNTADTYAYEYDDYGNRSKMTVAGSENYVTEYNYNNAQGNYTALLQKEIKNVQSENNALNNNSNVKQTVYTYDANGNQITKTADGKTETNTYDGLNQLIGFTDGETNASYKYNVAGLRIEKVVNGQRINHVWDGSKQIVADIVEGDTYNANCYVRRTSLAAKYKFVNGSKSEYTYYTQNAHGDVVNLTDADGEVTKKYTYDAFGVEKNIDDSDANPFRYCGEYFDTETGTVYLRARYYNPTTGRFISRDSVTGKNEDPLSLNLYTYCHNNPVLNFDPSGHIKCHKFIKSIGNWFEDRADDWETGIDMLKDGCWGSGGKRFASYSEGVVDTLCGYVEGVDKFFDHPIQTTCNAVGQLILDPAKPIREMSVNMALAIHTRNWDSVAYQVGGLTTHTAVIGTTYMAASGIPSSINVKIPKISTAALTNGRTALAVSTTTARVSTAGAVSIGKAAAGVNIMYSRPSRKGKVLRGGSKKQRDNWYGYDDKDFQNWWHRKGKAEYGYDIEDEVMAKEVYEYWEELGKPKVK